MRSTDGHEQLRREILARLDGIQDPCSVAGGTPMGLHEMGLVGGVEIGPRGDVEVQLRLTSPFCHMIAFMRSEAIERIGALEGVSSVTVVGDQGLDWSPKLISASARERRERLLQRRFARAAARR